MNKTKLKIIEMLGEFADKELKFGCNIISIADFKPIQYVTIEKGDIMTVTGLTNKYGTWVKISRIQDTIQIPVESYKIIGQYGLHNILRWIGTDYVICNRGRVMHKEYSGGFNGEYLATDYRLDLTKPPMERSEEQDKKLLEFMKIVKE